MSHPASIMNPAVRRAAELFTDGRITDAVLGRVASMKGLPLYLAPVTLDAADDIAAAAQRATEAEMRSAVAGLNSARRAYVMARAGIGEANRSGKTAAARRYWKSQAFSIFNQRRAELARAEKRHAAAFALVAAVAAG